ncbi:MAG: glucosidase [Chlamydiota bacterium]|jgi:hypothetical protein
MKSAEDKRLIEHQNKKKHWRRWGPYLSAREWGSVREDYSTDGSAWNYLPFEESHYTAYRWGEDAIAGISDNHQRLCFAFSFWNEKDPILKEKFFGLSGSEGNHGEDVKEYFFYLDNTPTHSYMKFLYKYPQEEFPYQDLREVNAKRNQKEPEYELLDTKIFDNNAYFDITIEYAKADSEDILIKLTIENNGPQTAPLHVLPTLWFRNTWSWHDDVEKNLSIHSEGNSLIAYHPDLKERYLYFKEKADLLFTENETNKEKAFQEKNDSPYKKDAFHSYVIHKKKEAVNPQMSGTKAALHYRLEIPSHGKKELYLRLTQEKNSSSPFQQFEKILEKRKEEADLFYEKHIPKSITPDQKDIQRQAFAGLLWSKQFYHYVIEEWLEGDKEHPKRPNPGNLRNSTWTHLYSDDILSIPDKWEYPWFASWDLAFHCVGYSLIDSEFAKRQLTRLTREWYMHPNGHIPSYEWDFNDVNPPVMAWAAWRVYKIEEKNTQQGDFEFLNAIYQKLLLNFTWWVNRKDSAGKNVFEGGFLGLDNISIFNRSDLPEGDSLTQSDATSWMGMYCLNMWTIAVELSKYDASYQDMASKFFEHFLYIAEAMNFAKEGSPSLWDEEDGFFYDVLHFSDGKHMSLKVKSMVGLIPLFAVATLEEDELNRMTGFKRRFNWFVQNRKDLYEEIASITKHGVKDRHIFAILTKERLKKVLDKMLDENEFFSPYGIRSVSKYHQDHPYSLDLNSVHHRVDYEPGESTSKLFGGNSNWRGPVWFPLNFLIIESLQKFHHYYGENFKVECPTGSGKYMTLWEIAGEISRRLIKIFERDENGKRAVYGDIIKFQEDPLWKDHILFFEYFHGDNGRGVGASHQTGWTALVAKLIQQRGEYFG